MTKFKGSPGKWKISGKTETFPLSIIIQHIINEGSNDAFNLDLCRVFPKIRKEQREANAELIVDAGNTINKCDLMPSELLEQRNTLIKTIIEVKDELNFSLGDNKAVFSCIEKLESCLDFTSKALGK